MWQSRHILMSRVRAEGDDVEVFSERWLGPVGVNMDFEGEEGTYWFLRSGLFRWSSLSVGRRKRLVRRCGSDVCGRTRSRILGGRRGI